MEADFEGLRLANLRFSYGPRPLLESVSFQLDRGERKALLGLNGTGKSTLLRCLTGFLKPTGGEVVWRGVAVDRWPTKDLSRFVCLVDGEGLGSFPARVCDLVLLGRSPHTDFLGRFSAEDERRARDAGTTMGLESLWERNAQELSRGEIQRVRLAMALACNPSFLLLDEPTSHLDPFHQREILQVLTSLASRQGLGTLAVLHDINQARHFDEILILSEGKIVEQGTPAEVIRQDILDRVFGSGVYSVGMLEGAPMGLIQGARRDHPRA